MKDITLCFSNPDFFQKMENNYIMALVLKYLPLNICKLVCETRTVMYLTSFNLSP